MTKTKFPVFAVIVLLFALVWLFSDLGYWYLNVPWLPVIVAVIAVGMIFNRFNKE